MGTMVNGIPGTNTAKITKPTTELSLYEPDKCPLDVHAPQRYDFHCMEGNLMI